MPIGTICVLDYRAREFTNAQIKMLRFLAKQTMAQLELRKKITEQRLLLARAKRAEREKANFERVVRQASDFIGMADKEGKVIFLNNAAREMVGIGLADHISSIVDEFIIEADRSKFHDEIVPAMKVGESVESELRLRNFKTGESFPALYTMFPLRGVSDLIVGYGVVAKDLSLQKQEQERRAHIILEAAHRMKNTLAIVDAIVSQTLKNATSLEQGRRSISERVRALALAQDILTATEGTAADIMDVVSNALLPHDPGHARIVFSGPSHLLSGPQSLGLSLAIHELGTNAAKYGALMGEFGTVEIAWTISSAGNLKFEWIEKGGAPVLPPTSNGFGSKLIQQLVAPYFDGIAKHDFPPEGVKFTLEGILQRRHA
jgi:PAS domain S-box-containing protein